jgi:hypothetical protein
LIGRMGIPSIGLPMVAIEEGSGGFALEEVRAWDAPRSNHGRISQGDTILIWYIRDKPKGKCTCTPQVWAQYCRAAETHALLPAAPLTHTRLLLHQSSSAYPPPPLNMLFPSTQVDAYTQSAWRPTQPLSCGEVFCQGNLQLHIPLQDLFSTRI